jgi:DNA-binding MarR family transcriptional regulator
MDQPDPTIHQPVRLKIMAALKALPSGGLLEFVRLKALVGATEGNLGAHITTLEEARYVEVRKDFHGKRPRTRVGLTRAGLRAFEAYVRFLRSIIDLEEPSQGGGNAQ